MSLVDAAKRKVHDVMACPRVGALSLLLSAQFAAPATSGQLVVVAVIAQAVNHSRFIGSAPPCGIRSVTTRRRTRGAS